MKTIACFVFLCATIYMVSAQTVSPTTPHEQYSGSYQIIDAGMRTTSPAFTYRGPGIFVQQVNVDSQGDNIVGDAANEPSIAVSPIDPSKMMIGWRQFDTQTNGFRQAGYGYTTNGGESWVASKINPGIFRSDPVLDVDAQGVFYYNSLTLDADNNFSCQVYRSSSDGTWGAGIQAQGGDKQWMAIDRTGGVGNGHIYSYWSSSYTVCPPDNSTRSTDGGDSYENCVATDPEVFWGAMDVGPDGTVYCAGNGGALAVSTNAKNEGEAMEWSLKSAPLGGAVGFNGDSPNPGGLLGQVWVATDHSGGSTQGNIYMLSSVLPATNDPLDVMFIRSADGGDTWSTAQRLNSDSDGNWQWFGTLSVAPNGRIDAVWLDTRDHPGTYLSSLYYAYSVNGGLDWSSNIRLSEEFDPHLGWPTQQKMGDYFHMVSHNDAAHLAWAGTFNGEQDVYYARIDPTMVGTKDMYSNSGLSALSIYPNPCDTDADINYSLQEHSTMQIKVYNALQQAVYVSPILEQAAGQHTYHWESANIANGIYHFHIIKDGAPIARKAVFVLRK